MSSTLLLASDAQPLTEGREILARLEHEIDAVLDGGDCGIEPTTVVDLSVTPPVIVRKGKGDLDRKSTRLNSSHLVISYAVFCLKKKKTRNSTQHKSNVQHTQEHH